MENQSQQQAPVPQAPIGMQPVLPYSTEALILGIVSIPTCCCFGLIGLACGIVAIVFGSKGIKLYKANPGVYTQTSYNNANAGMICGIIGTIMSSLYVLYAIVYLIIVGTMMSSVFSNINWGDIK